MKVESPGNEVQPCWIQRWLFKALDIRTNSIKVAARNRQDRVYILNYAGCLWDLFHVSHHGRDGVTYITLVKALQRIIAASMDVVGT